VVDVDGNPWFVAADVCRALGAYIRAAGGVNTNFALRLLGGDERQNLPYSEAKRIGLQVDASRAYGVAVVSESGLYKVIMRSDKPEAREFQDHYRRIPKEEQQVVSPMGQKHRSAVISESGLYSLILTSRLPPGR
jgi:prophage antirepressor-like protein